MPANVDEIVSGVTSKINNLPVIGNVVKNPFYTAVLICIIIMLIVAFVLRNEQVGDGIKVTKTKLILRIGVYALLAITAIQFLQNQYVMNEFKNARMSSKVDEVFKATGSGMSAVKKTINNVNSANSANNMNTVNNIPAPNVNITTTNTAPAVPNYTYVPVGLDVNFLQT